MLRNLIWSKLEPYLSDVAHVIIVPDAALSRVPWAALPGRQPDSVLLEDFALSTVSYGQRLVEILAKKPRVDRDDDQLLLVGDLDYNLPRRVELTSANGLETPVTALQ